MSRPRDISKIFSTATVLATDSELAIIDLSGAINTASAAALAAANIYTDNATPDLTPAIQAASAAAVSYTNTQISNIDLSSYATKTQLSASVNNIDLSSYATKSQLSASVANIDMGAAILTASTAAVSELNNRIVISSASPTTGNVNGRIWIDPTTASAPVIQIFGNNSFRNSSPRNYTLATGGLVTYSGAYTIHTFTSTSQFVVSGNINAEILVAAGGGGGGIISDVRAGGGGAGGLINIPSFAFTSGNYGITIGAGGTPGNRGANSVLTGNSRTVTALGGGSGGYSDNTNNGTSGGSGGGQWYPGYAGAAATQPASTSDGITSYANTGFGNAGGTSGGSQPYGSGGGGAGAVGGAFNAANGPVGGIGYQSSISGNNTYYAGGGGAAGYPPQAPYVEYNGGLGGGGRGSNDSFDSASNGTANLGGGGGSGGTGGSGVIIIRYLT